MCSGTSPEHWTKAMDLLQEQESYLDDNHIVALIDLFKADTAAADTYLALKQKSLWKVWIHKWLVHDLGFPDE